jgi:hypothetical protein
VHIALVAGDKSFGALLPAMAKRLEDAGARSVAVETIADSGHCPADGTEVAALIERYVSQFAR